MTRDTARRTERDIKNIKAKAPFFSFEAESLSFRSFIALLIFILLLAYGYWLTLFVCVRELGIGLVI